MILNYHKIARTIVWVCRAVRNQRRRYDLAKSKLPPTALTERPAAEADKIAYYVLHSRDLFNDVPDFVFRNRLRQQSRQRHVSPLRLHAYT